MKIYLCRKMSTWILCYLGTYRLEKSPKKLKYVNVNTIIYLRQSITFLTVSVNWVKKFIFIFFQQKAFKKEVQNLEKKPLSQLNTIYPVVSLRDLEKHFVQTLLKDFLFLLLMNLHLLKVNRVKIGKCLLIYVLSSSNTLNFSKKSDIYYQVLLLLEVYYSRHDTTKCSSCWQSNLSIINIILLNTLITFETKLKCLKQNSLLIIVKLT